MRLERYEDPLEVDAVEPLMDYLLSTEAGRSMTLEERDACRRRFETMIESDGAFHISTETGLYVASLATAAA